MLIWSHGRPQTEQRIFQKKRKHVILKNNQLVQVDIPGQEHVSYI